MVVVAALLRRSTAIARCMTGLLTLVAASATAAGAGEAILNRYQSAFADDRTRAVPTGRIKSTRLLMTMNNGALPSRPADAALSAPTSAQAANPALALVGPADAEGDGMVSQDEFTAFYSVMWDLLGGGKEEIDVGRTNPIVRAMILGVIPKATAQVSRDALLDAAPTRYRAADADGNGVVSLAEMRAWVAVGHDAAGFMRADRGAVPPLDFLLPGRRQDRPRPTGNSK